MLSKTTNIAEDGGCSGFTAFISLGWSDNNYQELIKYKGFELSINLRNFRTSGGMWGRQRILIADWKNKVENELTEYDADDYDDYKNKVREKKEKDKEEKISDSKQKEKELAEEPYNPEEGKYQKLFDEIKELKKDKSKPLEIKEKDIQAIMQRVDAKSKEEAEKINEQITKQEEQTTNLAKELKEAQNNKNKTLENKIMTLLNQSKAEAAAINKKKKDIPTTESFKELLKEEQNTSWQFDWKSGRSWGFASLVLGLLFVIFFLFMWLWRKINSLLSSKN